MRVVLRLARLNLRRWWRQRVCAYHGHGLLHIEEDRLTIWCTRCGYESPGLDVETRAIRYAWMWERNRIRFQTLRRNGRRRRAG